MGHRMTDRSGTKLAFIWQEAGRHTSTLVLLERCNWDVAIIAVAFDHKIATKIGPREFCRIPLGVGVDPDQTH